MCLQPKNRLKLYAVGKSLAHDTIEIYLRTQIILPHSSQDMLNQKIELMQKLIYADHLKDLELKLETYREASLENQKAIV